jgi:hypothetical protein
MTKTYPAVLRGGQLEWTGEVPPWTDRPDPIPVDVVVRAAHSAEPAVPGQEELAQREAYVASLVAGFDFRTREEEIWARQRVEALERLAAAGGIKSIRDPVAWQREIRRDRPLPGREDDE